MIIELEDGLTLWLWHCLPCSYGVSLTSMLKCGLVYTYIVVVLIKFDQLKVLNESTCQPFFVKPLHSYFPHTC
jgi:hypothetical protein